MRQATSVSDAEFRAVLDERRLETAFQPILRLDSEEVVGYEALVRGPAATRFASAGSLLDAAYRSGRVVEFDWAARASACRAALAAGLTRETLLFLNVEPLALDSDCPRDLWPDIDRGFASLRVVLEVTERSLDRDPRALLRGIDRQRPTVAGLALDDVGADTRTLAMLPVLAVDVVKLDLTVTQTGPTPTALKVLDQTYEEAERTGAAILAEGVETAAHAAFARSVGACMGQGRLFGEAGPLPAAQPRHRRRLHL
ncbi:MAG TPA: EAL domain-containing protein, partial [Micromonosporaceae bacterium]